MKLTRLTCLAVTVAMLALTAHTAPQKGGKGQAVLTFDDLAGDAIRSDGLGSYDARDAGQDTRVIRTGTRTIHFDFSTLVTYWSYSPFGYGIDAGDIDSVTMTVSLADSSAGTVVFEFTGQDPEGDGTTDFRLTMSVSATISGDTWYLGASSDAVLEFLWQSSGIRGNGRFDSPSWELAGIYEMPWGAVLEG